MFSILEHLLVILLIIHDKTLSHIICNTQAMDGPGAFAMTHGPGPSIVFYCFSACLRLVGQPHHKVLHGASNRSEHQPLLASKAALRLQPNLDGDDASWGPRH